MPQDFPHVAHWRSVEDALPRDLQPCLLRFADTRQRVGYLNEAIGDWVLASGLKCTLTGEAVTHWMPLPADPEYTSQP